MGKELIYEKNNISLDMFSKDEQNQINKHLHYVIEENKKFNLTRINTFKEGELLHIEDSLVALPEINSAREGRYIDIGTGAGFPGVPLSIITKKDTTLVDSTQKKVRFLESVIEKMELSNVSTLSCRIEDISQKEKAKFTVVTARALTALNSLLELASPLLKKEGVLIAYKATLDEEERKTAEKVAGKFGLHLVSDRGVVLSDEKTRRRILTYEKYKEPEIALPRRVGMAQKRPYTQ